MQFVRGLATRVPDSGAARFPLAAVTAGDRVPRKTAGDFVEFICGKP
jgi:hypothetical protein